MPISARKSLVALAGALALVATLSSCSAGSTAATGDGSPAGGSDAVQYAADENTIVFGVVPDSVDTETNYQPLMDYIAKETGKKVEYHESTDYAALIEASVAGKIDVASFSGFTYVTAKNNGAKITPISSIITAEGQKPGYYSEAIVPKDSDIDSLKDFAGKKVCFVDPSSTSGYLFPSYNLLKAGVDPKTDVTPVFAGKHDVSVQKVAAGTECDAGFAEDSEVEKNDDVRVVAKTMVPGAPIVVSDTLPSAEKETLTKALSDVTIDQIIDAGVTSADSDGFRSVFYGTKPVDDEYYDLIRDICKTTKSTTCQA
ncbi:MULTISPECIES: phosphate/phosphite/phosphonate ABC transporter substrate-binding protein [Curtobacterium]|uniref:phosphate/phosphite/phosphonate ABC transporter substrate-binding protein n=1 Tax=Curtobacterium TaxID=2034 RepID=UPI0015665816|nr:MULTISPECIES: phosphate/phosphite/phosphonate ABC transporter substrate-binding protein [Curtobacterium]MBT1605966.1 phosphate/phosphite/phosphonate ABC transporter substrate-binding protein [Curtobacterium flaccumfaciens pv. betae]MBT1632381.1 phosphate/phosphite/phosphonate ABC transporter substrate-binding protein [Curtobacterium flaccumfaciens pv. oortii]MBT1656531.1 phosphate/phosphite/phosphonate ABC transporter substrate-binding protein [Curtobacterium flaccumfaciens pv. betae]MCE0456